VIVLDGRQLKVLNVWLGAGFNRVMFKAKDVEEKGVGEHRISVYKLSVFNTQELQQGHAAEPCGRSAGKATCASHNQLRAWRVGGRFRSAFASHLNPGVVLLAKFAGDGPYAVLRLQARMVLDLKHYTSKKC